MPTLTVAGFAPGSHLPGPALAGCTVGLAATLLSGRDLAPGARQLQALSPQQPHQPPKAA